MKRVTLLLLTLTVACAPAAPRLAPTPVVQQSTVAVKDSDGTYLPIMLNIAPEWQQTYARWWKEVTDCADLRGLKFSDAVPQVAVLPQPYLATDELGTKAGAAFEVETRIIWIAEPYANDSVVVKHEMLHAALWTQHIKTGWHPGRYFGPASRCRIPVTVQERPYMAAK